MRNLILTGGIRHDFDRNTDTVIDLLGEIGIASEYTNDINAGIERLTSEAFDMVTVMALRWRMEGNQKYEALRDEYGYSMPVECRAALVNYVHQGGGLFGLHTACICFDDWAEWRDLLGGSWVWGQSFHPPLGPVSVSPTGQSHALTAGISDFNIVDEVYVGLDLAPDTIPLLSACADDGTVGPVLWAHQLDEGRVVFDALGHDPNSLQHDIHSRLIQRSAAWACGFSDERVVAI
ncbi:MAG: type 1 glutamine amidotransferase [Parasphingorhabdus sp.]|jgi:type 1 glutamine amidotransferase